MDRRKETKYSYGKTYYCGICSLPVEQQNPQPIKNWAKNNNYTLFQCRRLLRKHYLLAMSFRGRLYVQVNPYWEGEL